MPGNYTKSGKSGKGGENGGSPGKGEGILEAILDTLCAVGTDKI